MIRIFSSQVWRNKLISHSCAIYNCADEQVSELDEERYEKGEKAKNRDKEENGHWMSLSS